VLGVNTGDVLVLIGDLAAFAAALFAFLALGKANETISEARADRREAEQDRLVRRLERIAELVEEIFWLANEDQGVSVDPARWRVQRGLLRQLILGLRARLPRCDALANQARSSGAVFAFASQARNEIEIELATLRGELPAPDYELPAPD